MIRYPMGMKLIPQIGKLINLVSESRQKQVRCHVLSDFPLVGVDGFSKQLNKLFEKIYSLLPKTHSNAMNIIINLTV